MTTQVKSTQSFINHSFCEVIDSMSTNSKNEMWTKITNPCRLKSELLKIHKFESVHWHKLNVASESHQTCRLLTADIPIFWTISMATIRSLFLRFVLILQYYVLQNISVLICDLRPYFFLVSVT